MTRSTARPPRRRGPRGDLDKQHILSSARAVVELDGAEGLTLRSVAAQAGVSPNAIYTYVPDMPTLAHDVADEFLAEWDLTPLTTTTDPLDALVAFVEEAWRRLVAHPGCVDLLVRQRVAGPGALALNEALLQFFTTRGGVDLATALDATTTLTSWLHGRALLARSDDEPPRATLTPDSLIAAPLTVAASRLPTDASSEQRLFLATLWRQVAHT